MSRQYRSVIKDCQEQLEHLAETGAASQASHYLAQVYQNYLNFCINILMKNPAAVRADVQVGVDLAPGGDLVHGQQPRGARHASPPQLGLPPLPCL